MSKFENYETSDLADFTSGAYLDYSMYVILDRALPVISDGLKPVQRRIIYAMSELGLNATSKHKKSARTVGDVLGKYHPHGDLACYEAMVLMAQNFSYRYPLVDGQGNWGSPDDPKSFAAMRYTESRMSHHSKLWLDEVEKDCIDWQPNFDGTMEEPVELPAQVPALLINGGTGIAVGMATDIPPHNLTEVLKATIHLLDNPGATTKGLMRFIKGPDYPTGAIVTSTKDEIERIYDTGRGSIRERCNWYKEGSDIIIDAVPYRVSPSNVLLEIGGLVQNKKLPMVTDLRDESDQDNAVRLVISVKRGTDVDLLMNFLFTETDLHKSHRVNMNAINLEGLPIRYTLKKALSDWLIFRRETVVRRCQSEREKIERRMHIIAGLLITYLNIDEVIRIIREEDNPSESLQKILGLSEIQAKAVLDTRLRQLAKLEEMTLRAENDKLQERLDVLLNVLNDENAMSQLMKDEMNAILKSYKAMKDGRRSQLLEEEAPEKITLNDMAPAEPITLVISQNEFVRGVKGHNVDPEGLTYLQADKHHLSLACKSNQTIALISESGRVFNLDATKLPGGRGTGDPLSTMIKKSSGDRLIAAMVVHESGNKHIIATNESGYTVIADEKSMLTRVTAGKQTFRPGDKLTKIIVTDNLENKAMAYLTTNSRIMLVDLFENGEETFPLGKTGKGLKAVNLSKGEAILDTGLVQLDESKTPVKIALRNDVGLVRSINDALKIAYVQPRGRTPRNLPKGNGTAVEIVCASEVVGEGCSTDA